LFKDEIVKRISFSGGFRNWHNHCDRAMTCNSENFQKAKMDLESKWDYVRDLKKNCTVGGMEFRMSKVIEHQIEQGVNLYCTFLDFDEYSKDKPFKAFSKIRDTYGKDIRLLCANQTLEPITGNKYWFEVGADSCDIVGSLPARDKEKSSEHMDIVLGTAKKLNKKVHVHVDQFNKPSEKETEMVLNKIVEHNMEGFVSLIHCISLNCHPEWYRRRMYERIRDTKTSVIACISAWIDHKRSEEFMPFHNSVCPIDEMIEYNIPIALGVDNQEDLMCPLNDGDMYKEVELLAKVLRLYNKEKLIEIATAEL
jgi:cytosine/adenosine deaminase-related metal-dependent hydrolase